METIKTPQPFSVSEGKLYFAYGTNMHATQMANICLKSTFQGKATIRDYRWQISQHGAANIVKSKNSCVEGLVYSIDAEDEKALDHFEDISKGCCQKHTLEVEFEQHGLYHGVKSALLPNLQDATNNPTNPLNEWRPPSYPVMVKALVYLCDEEYVYRKPGKEYTAQMEKALTDAAALGVSEEYIEKAIATHFTKTSGDNAASAAMRKTVEGFKSFANDFGLGKGQKD